MSEQLYSRPESVTETVLYRRSKSSKPVSIIAKRMSADGIGWDGWLVFSPAAIRLVHRGGVLTDSDGGRHKIRSVKPIPGRHNTQWKCVTETLP